MSTFYHHRHVLLRAGFLLFSLLVALECKSTVDRPQRHQDDLPGSTASENARHVPSAPSQVKEGLQIPTQSQEARSVQPISPPMEERTGNPETGSVGPVLQQLEERAQILTQIEKMRAFLRREGWKPVDEEDYLFPRIQSVPTFDTWRYHLHRQHSNLRLFIYRAPSTVDEKTVRAAHGMSKGTAIRIFGRYAVALSYWDDRDGRRMAKALDHDWVTDATLGSDLVSMGYEQFCIAKNVGLSFSCYFQNATENGRIYLEHWPGPVGCGAFGCEEAINTIIHESKKSGIRFTVHVAKRDKSEKQLSKFLSRLKL